MKIEEIWERIRVRSGQFILAKANIELDVDNFRTLVEDALSEYNKSRPFEKHYNIFIGNPRNFRFTPEFDDEVSRVPDWIAEATPARGFSSSSSVFSPMTGGMSNSELIDPLQAPWKYRKPLLSVSISGDHSITAVYNHVVTSVEEDNGNVYWECKTIDVNEDPWFFKLLQGMFLQGIGRSRRAFTMGDMPILMDGDQLFSEGQAIEEKALEDIHLNKKIYLTTR